MNRTRLGLVVAVAVAVIVLIVLALSLRRTAPSLTPSAGSVNGGSVAAAVPAATPPTPAPTTLAPSGQAPTNPAALAATAAAPAGATAANPSPASPAAKPANPASASSPSAASPPASPAPVADSAAKAAAPASDLQPPSFDVVRVNSDGTAVLAGRAPTTAAVDVTGNKQLIGTVTAVGDGSWALVLTTPLPEGTLELALLARLPDGRTIASDKVVVVSVPSRNKGGAAVAVLVDRNPPAAGPADKLVASPPKVLQGPGGDGGNLGLDAVSYGDSGGLSLTGRALPGQSLQIYLNDQSVGTAKADATGHWQLSPDQGIPAGQYRLRLDALNDQGKVISRRELPIERAAPELAANSAAQSSAVVVQPGNSLWRIARRAYGAGTRYVDLYQANRSQIRDPNLIYPGQILAMPPG